LELSGLVGWRLRLGLAELEAGDTLVATLDCTGGFYSRQVWGGVRLVRLLERAGPLPAASHVRVISHTGYRWGFDLRDARGLLLATSVGGEPLSHEHGAPARLVAPGRRGFQWVKWVTRIELHAGPDPGAAASTVWSSFTPGRMRRGLTGPAGALSAFARRRSPADARSGSSEPPPALSSPATSCSTTGPPAADRCWAAAAGTSLTHA
jgi:DMSO/TMAO reductase YedYZ molybdopterin-dependent catalytic subunit